MDNRMALRTNPAMRRRTLFWASCHLGRGGPRGLLERHRQRFRHVRALNLRELLSHVRLREQGRR